MDVMNPDDRQTLVDLLRRSDFSDARRMFDMLIAAAHSQGRVDGANEMATHILEKMETPAPAPNPYVPLPPTDQLEADIRKTVLAKFRPRGDLPDAT